MLDGLSLDQLRTFIAAAEEGNFSAAGRRLRRAQSVVSQTLANLEAQISVKLFERSGRGTTLTDQGHALLSRARAVASEVDLFKARAKGLAHGLETELSLVVDAMFPVAVLASAVAAFQGRFPAIPLRLHVEMWEAVADPVLDRRCAIGFMGSLSPVPPQFNRERVLTVRAIKVVSPQHPLATHRAPIPEDDPPEGHVIPMSAVYLTDTPLGPAGRWFIDRLKEEAVPRVNGAEPAVPPKRASATLIFRPPPRACPPP
jgi:DNA-binding transcriptional LysR family regulator